MRRTASIALTVVSAAVVVLLVAGCGTTANEVAATVGDRVVEVSDVDELAVDLDFLQYGLGLADAPAAGESSVDGDTARAVLMFEIERAAWFAELDRWGLEIDEDARSAAEQRLDDEIEAAPVDIAFSEPVRAAYIEYFAAQELLAERFARIDPSNDADLRVLYDASPTLWRRVCVEVVELDATDADAAREALAAGADPAALAEAIPTAELVADPARACVSTSQIQSDLRDAIESAVPGEVSDVVLIDAGGMQVGYVFRVVGRQRIPFEDAVPDLVGIVESFARQGPAAWVGLQVAAAQINPRYGSGVSAGPDGVPTIDPPPVPLRAPAPAFELPEGLDLPVG